MALFARRHLQRVLDENAAFLSQKQLSRICHLFNSVRDDYLATEWEQVITNLAHKLGGTVRYEPHMVGPRVPDLLYHAEEPPLEFIADVTTCSDTGLHKRNPVEALQEEFSRYLRKAKINAGGFHLEVDAYPQPVYRGSKNKPRLKLPKRVEYKDRIFNSGFRSFLSKVQAAPEQKHRFDAVGPDLGVHLSYDPARRGFGSGRYRSFTFANIIDENPVYYALKDKGDQLKATKYAGVKGIFLCDGGSEMLHAERNHWASYSLREVISEFFRQFTSISFVATCAVHEQHFISALDRKIWVDTKFHQNPKGKGDFGPLALAIARIAKLMPEPQFTPDNALRHLKSQNGMSGRYLGRLVQGGYMEMSLRTLQELLGGIKSVEEFEMDYGMSPQTNPFRRMLAGGRLISRMTVEHHPDKDDDTVRIEFGAPDAAIGPFREPAKPA